MLVPWMECENGALRYQAKSYVSRIWNVRIWFYATNSYNICVAGRMLEGELVVPS